MKKIIVLNHDTGVLLPVVNFALNLAEKEPCKINGLFLSNQPLDEDTSVVSVGEHADDQAVQANIQAFKERCKSRDLEYSVQIVNKNHLDTVLDETAFADLVLCNDNLQTDYFSMHTFLSSAYCPVILVPKNAPFMEEIIFTYDGNSSSILAMKQFTYLFPWCCNQKVYLASVVPDNIRQMEYDSLVREWVLLHYPDAEILLLKGDPKTEMAKFINVKKTCLVVMGAFGRNVLSRLLKGSLALDILAKTHSPIFITH